MAWHRPQVNVASDINVTPLVDVMLVLLIIFMVITPLLQNHVSVNLAPAVNPVTLQNASKSDAIIIAISHDGRTYLGNNMVTMDDITNQVQNLVQSRLDKTVYIRADGEAHFQAVAAVVDAVRDAGVDSIALETEKVDKSQLPPALQQ